MAKLTIKLNSAPNTPAEEKIFVIEYPETRRVKVRKVDVEKEIENIDKEVELKQDRKLELTDILKEINKL